MRTICKLLFISLFTVSFLNCSSDNDDLLNDKEGDGGNEEEFVELKLSLDDSGYHFSDSIDIDIYILSGNGGYKVTSSDEETAKVELIDSSKVRVSFIKNSSAQITITDKSKQKAQVLLDVNSEILTPFNYGILTMIGNISKEKIKYGSGGYTINDVIGKSVEFSIEDNMLITKGIDYGYSKCRVVDKRGYSFEAKAIVARNYKMDKDRLDILVDKNSTTFVEFTWGVREYKVLEYNKKLFKIYLHKANGEMKNDYIQIDNIDDTYTYGEDYISLVDSKGNTATIKAVVK